MISNDKVALKNKNQQSSFNLYSDLINKSNKRVFLANVVGDSMIDCGINCGDTLIIENTDNIRSGDIILAEINGNITVKRFNLKSSKKSLVPENHSYPIIHIKNTDKFKIRGKICAVIRKY